MPSIFAQTRLILNTSTVPNQLATIPASNDHTDGTWQATDVYPGEIFLNYTDGTLSFRTVSGIKTLQIIQKPDQQLYSVSATIPSGSIQALNSTPYLIIPVPTAGCIEVVSASVKYIPGTTPFPAGGMLNLVAANTTSANNAQMQLPASILTALPAGGNVYQRFTDYTTGGIYANILPAQGLYLWAGSSQAGGGNGYLMVNVLYRIINA